MATVPLIAMCDRWDIGGLSTAYRSATGDPGSSSTTAARAASGSRAWATSTSSSSWRTRSRLIGRCACQSGCPWCVSESPKCGNLNEPLNKNGAIELLMRLNG